MDTRSRQRMPTDAVIVDLKKVERTFKRYCKEKPTQEEREDAQNKGLSLFELKFDEFMTVSAEEEEKAKEKGLTTLQWKLRELYREILEQEFSIFREEQSLKGLYVSISGLTLQERMEKYPTVAEEAFKNWACHLGLSYLYGAGKDPDNLIGKVFTDASGLTVYERFHDMLCTLF